MDKDWEVTIRRPPSIQSEAERNRLRQLPRRRAEYTEDGEGRYAEVEGEVYPVLFQECGKEGAYEEDVQDSDEFSRDWLYRFVADINRLEKVILVKYLSANDWPFVGIYKASDAHGGNFLACRMGKKIAKLYPR